MQHPAWSMSIPGCAKTRPTSWMHLFVALHCLLLARLVRKSERLGDCSLISKFSQPNYTHFHVLNYWTTDWIMLTIVQSGHWPVR